MLKTSLFVSKGVLCPFFGFLHNGFDKNANSTCRKQIMVEYNRYTNCIFMRKVVRKGECNFMFAKNSKAYSVYLLFRFVFSLAVSMSTVLSIV